MFFFQKYILHKVILWIWLSWLFFANCCFPNQKKSLYLFCWRSKRIKNLSFVHSWCQVHNADVAPHPTSASLMKLYRQSYSSQGRLCPQKPMTPNAPQNHKITLPSFIMNLTKTQPKLTFCWRFNLYQRPSSDEAGTQNFRFLTHCVNFVSRKRL